jgi:hypothetical protein
VGGLSSRSVAAFRVEVAGEMRSGRYYSVDGYLLRDGLRAAIGANDARAVNLTVQPVLTFRLINLPKTFSGQQ